MKQKIFWSRKLYSLMKIGLYFGSFNPVHVGHLILANYIANHTNVEQVWLVVSPHNPLKQTTSLLNEYHRLHLVTLAIDDNAKLKASDVEFKLPKPSYTIDSLAYLTEKYPQHTFSVIIGSDSFKNIERWKNFEKLLASYKIWVYTRPGHEITNKYKGDIEIVNGPLLDISASYIRSLIKTKKSIQYLVPEKARMEIIQNNYYLNFLEQ